MKKVFVITGQTATGKTKLALNYAKRYNGELINADSRQIYKYLDIITGKDKEEFGDVPIHLYDVVDPKEYFSSYDFKVRAEKVIADILKRGRTPIIVGGTYFYISHLLYGVETENIKPDLNLRQKLAEKSVTQLQQMLQDLSAEEFGRLNESDRNNPRRLMRRIEIAHDLSLRALRLRSVQAPRSNLDKSRLPRPDKSGLAMTFDIELLALRFKKKEQLMKAIRQRVEKRLEQGAVEELKSLLKRGYKLTDPGLKASGCKEIAEFINGKINKQQLIEKWTLAEINYAKRQNAFMKRDKNIKWQLSS